jgi:hypothetical protein
VPNRNPPSSRNPQPFELVQQSFTRPGHDPLAVRQVFGAVTYGIPGYGWSRDKVGAVGVDEPAPAAQVSELDVASLGMVFDSRSFSAVRFYLDFVGGAGARSATVTAWRLLDNGDVVQGGSWAAVGHRVEVRDEHVVGRRTIYQLTNVVLGGASAIRIRAAGEGLGYLE